MAPLFYDKTISKINYKGENGSGVLISNTFKNVTLLLTASHCIRNDICVKSNDLKIFRQMEGELQPIEFKLIDTITLYKYDIAVIVMEYIADIPEYFMNNPKKGDKVEVLGFPHATSENAKGVFRYPLRMDVVELPGKAIIQLESISNLETNINEVRDNVKGLSGGGIWICDKDEYTLCGIITELTEKDGAFSSLIGITINEICHLVNQENDGILVNSCYSNFGSYKEGIYEMIEEQLMDVFAHQIPIIDNNVHPKDIVEHCGRKIVWPYSLSGLMNKSVWETWLIYLIIRCIGNQESLQDNNFYFIKSDKKTKKVKVIYDTKDKKISDFLKSYLENAYQDIGGEEIIILKTKEAPYSTRIAEGTIKNIVANVSSVISQKQGIWINEAKSQMQQISIIHIQEIVNQLDELAIEMNEEGITGEKLEKELCKKVGEVLS